MSRTANIQEIFRSIQGEGRYAGMPAVFVRFSGCNLRCTHCDTNRSWRQVKYCSYQPVEFGRRTAKIPNNISVQDCADMIYWLAPQGLVCFTGGEPLLQAGYISAVIKLLGNRYTYLIETNGTLSAALRKLPKQENIIYSVDLKPNTVDKFLQFYQAIPKQSDKYMKIILEKNINTNKIMAVLEKFRRNIPEIYLQPINNKVDRVLLQKITFLLDKNGYFYRLIPQMHKFLRLK